MPAHLTFKRDYFCLDDQLGFDRYVETIGEMIVSKNFQTPFCIGIHGEWGSGKTSFMRQLEKRLQKSGTDPLIIPVWFNPWRYSKEEHLIIPFLRTISAALEDLEWQLNEESVLKDKLKTAVTNLKLAARAIAYGATFKFAALALSGKEMIEREKQIRGGRSAEITEGLSDIYYRIIDHLQKVVVNGQSFRLVIFIDDLDRCLPEKAVELLEAIKLLLDLEGYLFILGVNRRVVEEGIREHYKFPEVAAGGGGGGRRGNLAEEYLEKMIQMPLELPPIEPTRKRKLIDSLLKDSSLKSYAKLIEYGIAGRPRDIVRFVNFLAFFCRLAEKLKFDLSRESKLDKPNNWRKLIKSQFSPEFYLKWAILVFAFREEHRKIIDRAGYFFDLQKAARRADGAPQEGAASGQPEIYLDERLRKVLAFGNEFAEEPWLIHKYVHLADAVGQVAGDAVQDASPQSPRIDDRDEALPQPGAMARVLRGPFLYGEEREKRNLAEDFEIDVFPVTNHQFCEYLNEQFSETEEPRDQAGKRIIYTDQSKLLYEDSIRGDKEWQISDGKPYHPVTGVTWFGAFDFCRWRTEHEKSSAPFRLPTEEEWEKAARGDGGNEYPWGNDFASEYCNTSESGKNGTTAVTDYPLGKSPNGCYDMAGNVSEWTASDYEKGGPKVLRGGSYLGNRRLVRCASRDRLGPDSRGVVVGFRCARTIK